MNDALNADIDFELLSYRAGAICGWLGLETWGDIGKALRDGRIEDAAHAKQRSHGSAKQIVFEIATAFDGIGVRFDSTPCNYPPGSQRKIVELMSRAERREELFHEDDKLDHEGCDEARIEYRRANQYPSKAPGIREIQMYRSRKSICDDKYL